MGERHYFQPLTGWDKVTVLLYRAGIVLSTVIISFATYLIVRGIGLSSLRVNFLLISLYVSVGLSVFFIHLYVSKFYKFLVRIYLLAIVCLILLFVVGKGNASVAVMNKSYGFLLLIPLSGCLGFVAAKEAFCFRLIEGYLLAMIMPLYLLLLSAGSITHGDASYGLILIAALLILFTLRKVFMPIHYDIGDKSAYT